MATMTEAEAELQLTTVQAAIEALVAGKRLTQLRVGSGSFARLYVFQEITLDNLKSHRDELLAYLATFQTTLPKFSRNMHIPLVVSKDIY